MDRHAPKVILAALAKRPDVHRLPWGALAVPHSSHAPGLAKPGSRLRERACVFDAGSFVHLSCCCGATPAEIAADLRIPARWLGPHAKEQAAMLKVQRRLRGSLNDAKARELLKLKGLTVQQALLWKPSDAGWPAELWSQGAPRVA